MEPIIAFFQALRFETTDLYFLIGVGSLVILSWFYHFFVFFRVSPPKVEQSANPNKFPLSLVVCARNAQEDLEKNIPLWLGQDYPNFELIIVDDCSTDESSRFITEMAKTDERIKYILLDPNKIKSEGKKLALTLGIKKASHEHLVLTDSDCTPSSDQWLKHMSSGFGENKSVVLGAAPLEVSGTFWGRLVHYENLLTVLNYLGLAKLGFPSQLQ